MRKTFFLEVCTRRLTLSFLNFPLSQNEGKWSFRSCIWKTFERISTPIEDLSDIIRRLSQIQVFILRFRFQLKSTMPERAKRAKIHRLDLKTWSAGGALSELADGLTGACTTARRWLELLKNRRRAKKQIPAMHGCGRSGRTLQPNSISLKTAKN